MFDHVALNVRDYRASKAFYEQALAPLGYRLIRDSEDRHSAGFGTGNKLGFLLNQRAPFGTGTHVAFTAADRLAVDAFHAAGLAAGGQDNGAPGLRPLYSPTYYGAFVLDPDGNNIEAVCHVGSAD
jgi:catechol 2,3-dioxygenase-like lactoylglutathione lyase family enzyme